MGGCETTTTKSQLLLGRASGFIFSATTEIYSHFTIGFPSFRLRKLLFNSILTPIISLTQKQLARRLTPTLLLRRSVSVSFLQFPSITHSVKSSSLQTTWLTLTSQTNYLGLTKSSRIKTFTFSFTLTVLINHSCCLFLTFLINIKQTNS